MSPIHQHQNVLSLNKTCDINTIKRLSAIGNPNDITYTLYNDGVESTSSNIYVNNSVLTMVNISREDMGSYALQAENNGGSSIISKSCVVFILNSGLTAKNNSYKI
jgi:hypothetical protein